MLVEVVVVLLTMDWADRRLFKMEDSLGFGLTLLLPLFWLQVDVLGCCASAAIAADTTDSKLLLVVLSRHPALWELCKFAFVGLLSKGETKFSASFFEFVVETGWICWIGIIHLGITVCRRSNGRWCGGGGGRTIWRRLLMLKRLMLLLLLMGHWASGRPFNELCWGLVVGVDEWLLVANTGWCCCCNSTCEVVQRSETDGVACCSAIEVKDMLLELLELLRDNCCSGWWYCWLIGQTLLTGRTWSCSEYFSKRLLLLLLLLLLAGNEIVDFHGHQVSALGSDDMTTKQRKSTIF